MNIKELLGPKTVLGVGLTAVAVLIHFGYYIATKGFPGGLIDGSLIAGANIVWASIVTGLVVWITKARESSKQILFAWEMTLVAIILYNVVMRFYVDVLSARLPW